MVQIGPILLGFIGFVVYKERINRMQMLGFFITFLGLSLFYFNQIEGMLAMTALFYLDVEWIETSLMGFITFIGAVLVIFGAILIIHFRKK